MKIQIKNKVLSVLGGIVILGTILFTTTIANAQLSPIYGKICRLGVFPYDPGASSDTLGTNTNQYINYLDDSACTQHVQYGSAYSPQPPLDADNPLKSNTSGIRTPISNHVHAYYNDKNAANDSYYYKAFVDKFEITLRNDSYNNIKLDKLACYTPSPTGQVNSDLNDCDGYDANIWGGTRITKTINSSTSTVTITWNFAENAPNIGRPEVMANNGGSFKTYNSDGSVKNTINLTDPQNRVLAFSVDLPTKDADTIWSATTTSRVLFADLALKKTNYPQNFSKGCTNNDVNSQNSGWCYLTPPSGSPVETIVSNGTNRTFHWYQIGSVSNIWKKPAVPQATCTGITLTPSALGSTGTTDMTATVTFSDGKVYNNTVTWTATGGTLSNSQTTSQSVHQSTYTKDSTPSGSVKAVVTSVDGAQNSSICQAGKTVSTPPPAALCQKLNATPTPPISIQAGTLVTLSGNPVDTENKNISKIYWSETGPGYYVLNTASGVGQFPGFCPTAQDGSFTAPAGCQYIYQSVSSTDAQSASFEASPNTGNVAACKAAVTVTLPPPEKPYCTSLTLTPDILNQTGSTNLNASLQFSDGSVHPVKLQWGVANGILTGLANDNTQTKSSNELFNTTFFISNSSNPAYVNVFLSQIMDGNADLGNCGAARYVYTPPQTDKCTNIYYHYTNDGQICIDFNDQYRDGYTLKINGSTYTKNNGSCTNISNLIPNTSWNAFATGEPENAACQVNGTTPDNPPRLYKTVSKSGLNQYGHVSTISTTTTNVNYKVEFFPSRPNTSVRISDPIGNPTGLQGKTRGSDGEQDGGKMYYVKASMTVDEQGRGTLPQCSTIDSKKAPIEHCYNGTTPETLQLVKIDNKITITYTAKIEKKLTDDICKEGKICQELYNNKVTAYGFQVFDEQGNEVPVNYQPIVSDAIVQIFCSYILNRAAGDLYLEQNLTNLIDIRQCSKYRTSTGLIIVPDKPNPTQTPSTGQSTIVQIDHGICTKGQTGNLPSGLEGLYGNDVSSLSSNICEVKLQTGGAWKQNIIVNDIKENKTRISRWEPDFTGGANMATITSSNSYADKKVFRVQGNLTIAQAYTLNDGEGAKTFIVENGDLIIGSDIKYGTCRKTACTVTDTASLAFIVLNGNVYVSPSVKELSGVFFVQGDQPTDGTPATNGYLYSGTRSSNKNADSENKLTIYGSVYGDLSPLISNRIFAGDPASEDAGIVVRFDQRIMLNTPPGLRDVLDITQTDSAR